jgi:hypothetical protein
MICKALSPKIRVLPMENVPWCANSFLKMSLRECNMARSTSILNEVEIA